MQPPQIAPELNELELDFSQTKFRADPYSLYRQLRARGPILYFPAKRQWFLTRYADIVAILKDSRFGWGSQDDYVALAPVPGETAARKLIRLRQASEHDINLWMGARNPPDHTRLRSMSNSSFTPQAMEGLRPVMQAIADRLLAKVLPAGRMDLLADLAYPFSVEVVAYMMGVPAEDCPQLSKWCRLLQRRLDYIHTPVEAERGAWAMAALTNYFRKMITRRGDEPGDDLIGRLMRAHAQGKCTFEELAANCTSYFFAGQEGTAPFITGAILHLLQHPDQWRKLQDDASLLPDAVSELLRYDPPGQIVWRVVLEEVEFQGHTFAKGEQVVLLLAAANRDPEIFPDPDRLDIARKPGAGIHFGYGIHYCIGGPFARVESEVIIGTLARQLPNLALAGPDEEWDTTTRVRRLKSLPLVF